MYSFLDWVGVEKGDVCKGLFSKFLCLDGWWGDREPWKRIPSRTGFERALGLGLR